MKSMTKIFYVGLAIVLFTACDQKDTRYTQDSPEIDSYRESLEAYNNRDWEKLQTFYADTARIMNNVTENEGLGVSEMIKVNKEDAAIFTNWRFIDKESDFEMVVTDEGETWVNFWGQWEGTLEANNQKYIIPAHITTQFKDGKIVKEFGYWDVSKLVTDIRNIEEAKTLALKENGGEPVPSSK